jgi:D-serine deaminase-like pyridoxal phosphate-dependent protein
VSGAPPAGEAWRRPAAPPGSAKEELDTPALLLDMGAVESNIAAMAAWFRHKPCGLRPHAKTHKLPLIARMQIDAGAVGITCAKLSEAEVFLRSGIREVLVANEVAGPRKIERLMEIAGLGNLVICVDNEGNAREISEAAIRGGTVVSVLVEVDTVLGRCGVKPGRPTLELVRALARLRGLRFRGLMGYEGGCYLEDETEKAARCAKAYDLLVETRDLVSRDGHPVEIVTAGGSNTYALAGVHPGITDLQVGSYVTMDTHGRAYGLTFAQALTVLATVVSRPEPARAIIDAGMKALSADHGMPFALREGVSVARLDEEHGRLALTGPAEELAVGDKIELVPSHGCTTIPLHEQYVLVRHGRVEGAAPILARGALF